MNRASILLLVLLLSILLGACQVTITAPPAEPVPSAVPLAAWGGIRSPAPESIVSGDVAIVGSATLASFQKYELHYKPEPGTDHDYIYFAGNTTPVENGVLGIWATQGLTAGEYTLRLRVVKNSGEYVESHVYAVNLE